MTATTIARPRAVLQPPALSVSLHGELLQPAELRITRDGMSITVHMVLAQPGTLPPVCAEFRSSSDRANYVFWRMRIRHFARGTLTCIDGHGLRTHTLNGRRVLMLEHTHAVRLLQPPFDARAAAAGDD